MKTQKDFYESRFPHNPQHESREFWERRMKAQQNMQPPWIDDYLTKEEQAWLRAVAGDDPPKPGMFETGGAAVKFCLKMCGVFLLFSLAISGLVLIVANNMR